MILSKEKLYQGITAAKERVTLEQQEYDDALAAYKDYRKRLWDTHYAPAWRDVADLIGASIELGQPITETDINKCFHDVPESEFKSWSNKRAYWHELHSKTFTFEGTSYSPVTLDKRLLQLEKALDTVKGDEVSTSALRDMGFRNLEWFFRSVV
jgi:hypothetical protein